MLVDDDRHRRGIRRWPGMRWGRLALLVSVLVSLVSVSASCSKEEPPAGTSGVLGIGEPAPGFALPSAEGRTVSLETFRGKTPVLLYFSMGPG